MKEKGTYGKERACVGTKRAHMGTKRAYMGTKGHVWEQKGHIWERKGHIFEGKMAHIGTKRHTWERKRKIKGEIGYISKRNILVWNEIIILKTLNIAKHNRNMKISIFQKTVFGEKGTPIYCKKVGGAAAPLAPPASPPLGRTHLS